MSDKKIFIKKNPNSVHPTGQAGFSSPNFPHDRKMEMARKGGRNSGNGFATLSPEEMRRIAKKGYAAMKAGVRKVKLDPFDV